MDGSRHAIRAVLAGAAVAVLGIGLTPAVAGAAQPDAGGDVVATGLDNPRHLQFDDEGVLYVAESGSGGDQVCAAGPEGGEACFGSTGAITAIRDGNQERVVTGLPSRATAGTGTEAAGPSDVAPSGKSLLVTVGYGGVPADRAALPAEFQDAGWLLKADPENGTTERFADIAGFEGTDNPDGEAPPDSNPNAVIARGGGAVVADAGGNSLVAVSRKGAVSLLATFPPRPQTVGVQVPEGPPVGAQIPAQAVPTSVTRQDGSYYVGELTGFPFAKGGAQIDRVRGGEVSVRAGGFTNVVDVEAGPKGALYVVEIAKDGLLASPPGQPPVGQLLRLDADGSVTVVAELPAPGGVAIRDGSAYVTTHSTEAGAGQVVRVDL
jgi:hypothetical protein